MLEPTILGMNCVFALDVPAGYKSSCWENGESKKLYYLNNGHGVTITGNSSLYGKFCGCRIAKPGSISIGWSAGQLSCDFNYPLVPSDTTGADRDFLSCSTNFENSKLIESIFLNSSSQYGGCPSQDGYDRIYQIVDKEMASNKIERQQSNREAELKRKQTLSYLQGVCKGSPQIYTNLLETIANQQNVNPKSITLQRIQIDSSGGWDKCMGTFYSPRGSQNREIKFDKSGVINYVGPGF